MKLKNRRSEAQASATDRAFFNRKLANGALVVTAMAAGVFAACSAGDGSLDRGGPSSGNGGSSTGSTGNGAGGAAAGTGFPGGGVGATLGMFPTGTGGQDGPFWDVYVPGTGEPECTDPPPPPPVVPPGPTLVTLDECTGQVDAATQASLEGGGSTSGARILYPYNGTVFPGGLPSPEIQWEQTGTVSAVRLHIQSTYFNYTGCFGANSLKRLTIPQDIWDTAAEQTQGGSDPFTIELTTMAGGVVTGPLTQQWTIARGNLQGALFYNTYTSPQAGNNGAVMRLHLGATQPEVLLTDVGIAPVGPCWSCHSLSAGGGMLVAQHHAYPLGPFTSASFNIGANPNPSPPPTVTLDSAFAEMGLGAVSPDGTKVLTMGSPGDWATSGQPLFPDAPGNVPGMIGPRVTRLLDTTTGQQLPTNGWTVQYAKMPSFSPDGTKVVFNWHEDGNGHSLAIADFDSASNTFSNVHRIYNHATLYPGWPFLTPDNKDVIFVLGNAQDYVSSYPGRIPLASSDLYIVDVATGNARPLARANGYPSDGAPSYLPQVPRDEHLTYFPTVSPVSAGGYYWAFFTSRRTYGNTITQIADDAPTKKIWVSAIAIRPDDSIIADPSYPPFYLPGQESAAGNIRAFAALEPCRADGGDCDSGIDCCGGHCYAGSCGLPPPPPPPPPNCAYPPPPPPPECSEIGGRCNVASDCCDPEALCLQGYCGFLEPIR